MNGIKMKFSCRKMVASAEFILMKEELSHRFVSNIFS